MPDTISRYGWEFSPDMSDLDIEFHAIRKPLGYWRKAGSTGPYAGRGHFFHYRRAMELLWPEDDHHRWSDLMLKTIIDERITVVQGGKDSSKTRTAAKFALVDYWAFPR